MQTRGSILERRSQTMNFKTELKRKVMGVRYLWFWGLASSSLNGPFNGCLEFWEKNNDILDSLTE